MTVDSAAELAQYPEGEPAYQIGTSDEESSEDLVDYKCKKDIIKVNRRKI